MTGQGARALAKGNFHSASAIDALGLVSKAAGWRDYHNDESRRMFSLGDFHDMDLPTAPEPVQFTFPIAELHQRGTSPNCMFVLLVPTVSGRMQRTSTVTWENDWAKPFTHQPEDVV